MVAVSPFFATTRLLNEIRSTRARLEATRGAATSQPSKTETATHVPRPHRKPK